MFETKHIQTLPLPSYFCFYFNLEKKVKQPHGIMWLLFGIKEYIKIDRDKSTFKSHRDFDSEKEMTFKHF